MKYLLDTNVASQFSRRRPDPRALRWLAEREAAGAEFHISAVSLGEMRRGALMLPAADGRRAAILAWLQHDLPKRFGNRQIAFTPDVAETWASMMSILRPGLLLPAFDTLIAATAIHHELFLATGDADMARIPGLVIRNPFRD